eukprot:g9488.t1
MVTVEIKNIHSPTSSFKTEIQPEATVLSLKQAARDQLAEHPAVEQQRLVYQGRLLLDHDSLKSVFFRGERPPFVCYLSVKPSKPVEPSSPHSSPPSSSSSPSTLPPTHFPSPFTFPSPHHLVHPAGPLHPYVGLNGPFAFPPTAGPACLPPQLAQAQLTAPHQLQAVQAVQLHAMYSQLRSLHTPLGNQQWPVLIHPAFLAPHALHHHPAGPPAPAPVEAAAAPAAGAAGAEAGAGAAAAAGAAEGERLLDGAEQAPGWRQYVRPFLMLKLFVCWCLFHRGSTVRSVFFGCLAVFFYCYRVGLFRGWLPEVPDDPFEIPEDDFNEEAEQRLLEAQEAEEELDEEEEEEAPWVGPEEADAEAEAEEAEQHGEAAAAAGQQQGDAADNNNQPAAQGLGLRRRGLGAGVAEGKQQQQDAAARKYAEAYELGVFGHLERFLVGFVLSLYPAWRPRVCPRAPVVVVAPPLVAPVGPGAAPAEQ